LIPPLTKILHPPLIMRDESGEKTQFRTIARVGVPVQYPLLNETNYGLWAVKMKIILGALGVWEAVEGNEPVEKERIREL
jgi:Domain of unknown function (DUF4219)